jgi:hypothetical protein
MDIKFFSVKKIESDNTIGKDSYSSAKRLFEGIKVDYITTKHIGFTCEDKVYNSKHSVIYFSEKEFPNSWNCDCHWHSIKNGFCKHILSVFLRLNQDENFLKKFRKTCL